MLIFLSKPIVSNRSEGPRGRGPTRYAYFSSGWVFFQILVGLGKPKLCIKFEVASFSLCVNIEGDPQILGSTSSLGPCLPFLLRVILSWTLANSSCVPNLKSLAPSVAEILKRKPQISGSYPSSGSHPLFLLAGFHDGP